MINFIQTWFPVIVGCFHLTVAVTHVYEKNWAWVVVWTSYAIACGGLAWANLHTIRAS